MSLSSVQLLTFKGGSDVEGTIISHISISIKWIWKFVRKEYQADMTAAGFKNFEYTSIRGYTGASICWGIKGCWKRFNSYSVVKLESLSNIDLGGFPVRFSSTRVIAATILFYMTVSKMNELNKLLKSKINLGSMGGWIVFNNPILIRFDDSSSDPRTNSFQLQLSLF